LHSNLPHAGFAARASGNARVAELVDALDSGSSTRKGVQVRVLSRAPFLFSMSYRKGKLPSLPFSFYPCA
jgi:hypothetical protein